MSLLHCAYNLLLLRCRNPNNVKALLRAAQAHIGLGSGEYSSAAGYLQQALQQAQEQQLPTRGEPSNLSCPGSHILVCSEAAGMTLYGVAAASGCSTVVAASDQQLKLHTVRTCHWGMTG
jgi:hypothetical protein